MDETQQLVSALIDKYAQRYGLDPQAVRSVAQTEGGVRYGAVGDGGTSFGPFQLHVGGALPSGRDASWANSEAGIEYALRQMSGGAKGLKGAAAIDAIVRRFERPANPEAEINKALGYYGGGAGAIPAQGGGGSSGAGMEDPETDHRSALINLILSRTQAIKDSPGPNDILRILQGG